MSEYLTEAEIDALPVGTRVRDRVRDIWTRNDDGTWTWSHHGRGEPLRSVPDREFRGLSSQEFYEKYPDRISLEERAQGPDYGTEEEEEPLHWGFYSQAVRIAKMLAGDLEANSGTPFENMAYVTRVEMAVEGTEDTFMVIEWSEDTADYTIKSIGG